MFLKEFMFNVTELGGLEMRLKERSNERQNDVENQETSPGVILEHTLLRLGQRIRAKANKALFKNT